MSGERSPAQAVAVLIARVALAATTVILSLNLWTGFPLLALWLGSQATGGQLLSMTGVATAVIALVILLTVGVMVLSRISVSYDKLTRRPPPVRQPRPWLLSMSSAKVQPAGRREVNAIEAIVVAAVVAAFIAFEAWFFLLAKSSLSG